MYYLEGGTRYPNSRNIKRPSYGTSIVPEESSLTQQSTSSSYSFIFDPLHSSHCVLGNSLAGGCE